MSQRLLKALGAVTAISVVATLGGVSPAQAREPDEGPSTIVVQAKADGPDHFNSSVSVDIPAGGTAQVLSPTLDKKMTKAKVEIEAPLSDATGFKEMALTLLQQPTPGKRLLTCITHAVQRQIQDEDIAQITGTFDEYEAVAEARFLIYLTMCVRLAALIASVLADQPARPAARLAGTRCGQAPVAFKTAVTQSGGELHGSTSSTAKIKPKSAKVKVKCKLVGTKIVMTIKAKKKGKTLRSVLGKNVAVGLGSPSSAEEGANVKVSFKAP